MLSVESVHDEHSTEDVFKFSLKSVSNETLASAESSVIEYIPEEGAKMKLYKQGLYSPGSGEICAKYITMSRSSMLRHPYYAYPSVKDPGIMEALLSPEKKKKYDVDGQELYLDLCEEMKVIPVRCFYKNLISTEIDLKYYGVNPVGVRAMCMALAYNQTVKRLDLTSNFMEHNDACYHLGQLLGCSNALDELVLSGCKLGSKGMYKLVVNLDSRKMDLLDISGNNIQDTGFTYLIQKIQKGAVIRKLYLRRNDLTSESLVLLAEAMEGNNTITHLDLSWNKFIAKRGQTALLRRLGCSTVLVELNMAWSSISITMELKSLFGIPTLKRLDLSNNCLPSRAARVISTNLNLSKSLAYMDLSCNPFTPTDALLILLAMSPRSVKLKELHMDNIAVDKEFAAELHELKKLPYKKNTVITHGDVLRNYTLEDHDLRVIIMRRIVVVTTKKKGAKLDILEYILQKQKILEFLNINDLARTFKIYGIRVEEEFFMEVVRLFPGPRTDKGGRTIDLNVMVDYIHRLWPDKKLPPTPPPTPPPEKEKKGKKKKK